MGVLADRNLASSAYDIMTGEPITLSGTFQIFTRLNGVELPPTGFVVLPSQVDAKTSSHNLNNLDSIDSTTATTWEVEVRPSDEPSDERSDELATPSLVTKFARVIILIPYPNNLFVIRFAHRRCFLEMRMGTLLPIQQLGSL